jgi:(S)-ureidoglycine aminohydrolase
MEISALTRSVVKRNHAVIAPDGYINSNVPGWTNCTVNVIINEQMGANLCQTLITAGKGCQLKGSTKASQIFFYVVEGETNAKVGDVEHKLSKGQFVYIPINKDYTFDSIAEGTQLLTFHKVYEHLEGYSVPDTLFGDQANIEGPIYMNDEALRIQVLLPADLHFDMAVNIFTYQTGGNLPMVETHIMEHGLLYLQGIPLKKETRFGWHPIASNGLPLWVKNLQYIFTIRM